MALFQRKPNRRRGDPAWPILRQAHLDDENNAVENAMQAQDVGQKSARRWPEVEVMSEEYEIRPKRRQGVGQKSARSRPGVEARRKTKGTPPRLCEGGYTELTYPSTTHIHYSKNRWCKQALATNGNTECAEQCCNPLKIRALRNWTWIRQRHKACCLTLKSLTLQRNGAIKFAIPGESPSVRSSRIKRKTHNRGIEKPVYQSPSPGSQELPAAARPSY